MSFRKHFVWGFVAFTALMTLGCVFAVWHFAMRHARAAIAWYRDQFKPSAQLAQPYAVLAVTVVCGEDDRHAERIAAPIRLAVVRNRTGRRAPVADVEEALAYQFSAEEQAIGDEFLMGAVIGGPARVIEGLERLAADTKADELMLSGLIGDHDERRLSHQPVALAGGFATD